MMPKTVQLEDGQLNRIRIGPIVLERSGDSITVTEVYDDESGATDESEIPIEYADQIGQALQVMACRTTQVVGYDPATDQ